MVGSRDPFLLGDVIDIVFNRSSYGHGCPAGLPGMGATLTESVNVSVYLSIHPCETLVSSYNHQYWN